MRQFIFRYCSIMFLAFVLLCPKSFAADLDNGRDRNDKFIVASVLAQRCGLSSQNPVIGDDCIKRLAYDYKTDFPPGYENYESEKKDLLGEYAAAYLYKAIVQMIAGGDYDDRIDELIKQDPTISVSTDNDSREKMEFNNKLASDNSTVFLQAIDLRSSEVNLLNTDNIVNNLVKQIDVDTDDASLALPPSQ